MCRVWPWINICRKHQATCRKMLLPYRAGVYCLPDFNNGCRKVRDFITSREDYCKSVFSNVSVVHLNPLQSMLHAAVCFITRKRKYDHTTATIHDQQHGLPVKQQIDYNCLHYMVPCIYVTSAFWCHQYRVALASGQLLTATYGEIHLAPKALRCMNHLYACHCSRSTYRQFCSKLKCCLTEHIWCEQLCLHDNNLCYKAKLWRTIIKFLIIDY